MQQVDGEAEVKNAYRIESAITLLNLLLIGTEFLERQGIEPDDMAKVYGFRDVQQWVDGIWGGMRYSDYDWTRYEESVHELFVAIVLCYEDNNLWGKVNK